MIQCVPLANLYDFLLLTKCGCISSNLASASKSIGTEKREKVHNKKRKYGKKAQNQLK